VSAVIEEFEWLGWKPNAPGEVGGGAYVGRGMISLDLCQVTAVCNPDPTSAPAITQIYILGHRDPHTISVSYDRFIERWRMACGAQRL